MGLKNKAKKAFKAVHLAIKNPIYVFRIVKGLRKNGLKWAIGKVKAKITGDELAAEYFYEDDLIDAEKMIEGLTRKPLISVVMPVYNVEVRWIDEAVNSVLSSSYQEFELIIVDDASTSQDLRKYLDSLIDHRIKILRNEQNLRISETTDRGIREAKGEFIVLMDNDDLYSAHALLYIALEIVVHDPDMVYTDEDKVDVAGIHKNPFYKPDWSPDLLRSQMYIGHIMGFKKSVYLSVGGFRKEFDGSQDYDLALRISEQSSKISHIPKVLYSWREIPTSTALNPESKPYAHIAGLRALDSHLKRVYGSGARAVETKDYYVYDARYPINPEKVRVSIIIPTKDKVELLEPCVRSILEKTVYPNYEIIIMNNNSVEIETLEWFKKVSSNEHIRIVNAPYQFNWSKLNNHGIREATGDVFIFLNNDTLVISGDWLERLSEKAIREDAGTVGALLLYEDGKIQHAGVVIGLGGWADHVFKNMAPVHYGTPYVSPVLTRNTIAVTGACMAVSRMTIEKIGNFDENFIICGSDVELGIRAHKNGLWNIYDSRVELYHLESKSRDSYIPEIDFEMSKLHYMEFLKNGDPYYNINLDLTMTSPSVKKRRN